MWRFSPGGADLLDCSVSITACDGRIVIARRDASKVVGTGVVFPLPQPVRRGLGR
jgi:hypothetical protein